MTVEIVLLFGLLVAAIVLFATEWIAPEITAVLLLLALIFSGLLTSEEAFAGFGSDVVVFLGSLFVVSQAMVRTGVLDRMERAMGRLAERFPGQITALLVGATAALSSVLSNTATVSAMLPVASGLARRLRLSPSRLYMPLAFASILGGSLTLIGTSTNIVVASALPRFDQPPWGFLELTPAALPAVVLGLVYLLTLGQRLLPERDGELTDLYRLREYVSEVVVPPASPWVGRTLRELRAGADLDIAVLGLIGDGTVEPMGPDEPLAAGDHLQVKANRQALLGLKVRQELDLVVDREAETPLKQPVVHELVVPHGSRLSGRTLRDLAFGRRHGVMVLAVFRKGEPILDRISSVELRDGDLLLVQGDLSSLAGLMREGNLIVLGARRFPPPDFAPGWRRRPSPACFSPAASGCCPSPPPPSAPRRRC